MASPTGCSTNPSVSRGPGCRGDGGQGCLPWKGTCITGVLGRTRNSVWVLLFQGPSRRKRLQSNHWAISWPFPPLMPPLRGKHQVKDQPLESGRTARAEALPLSLPPRSVEISRSQVTTSARRRWCHRRTLASWGMGGRLHSSPLAAGGVGAVSQGLQAAPFSLLLIHTHPSSIFKLPALSMATTLCLLERPCTDNTPSLPRKGGPRCHLRPVLRDGYPITVPSGYPQSTDHIIDLMVTAHPL